MMKVRSSALLGIVALLAGHALAQNSSAPEYALKTAYLYHFLEFTTWPKPLADATAPLGVCVSRDNPWRAALTAMSERLVHNRPIRIVPLAESNRQQCEVMVLRSNDIGAAANDNKQRPPPTLIVSDDPALTEDIAMINLRIEDNRIVFSINNSKAQTAGLTISSKLLRLARTVQ